MRIRANSSGYARSGECGLVWPTNQPKWEAFIISVGEMQINAPRNVIDEQINQERAA